MKTVSRWWWETVTLLLAANSVMFAVLGVRGDNWEYAIFAGIVPAVLLVSAVLVRGVALPLAAVMAVVGALTASITWWMIYPVVLGVMVIAGGFMTGKLGSGDRRTALA
jgi:hypothetical protein